MTNSRSPVIAAALAACSVAHADPTDTPPAPAWSERTHVDVETSPGFFAMGGYFAAAGLTVPAAPRYRFVATVFAIDIPQAFIAAKGTGWSQHDTGGAIGVDRTFGDRPRGGWFAAANFAVQSRRASRSDGSAAAIEEDLELAGGFRWFPAHSLGLTITPELGVAIPLHRSSTPVIDGMTFAYEPVAMIPSVNVGWAF